MKICVFFKTGRLMGDGIHSTTFERLKPVEKIQLLDYSMDWTLSGELPHSIEKRSELYEVFCVLFRIILTFACPEIFSMEMDVFLF